MRSAMALRDAAEREPLFPLLRIGVHRGSVVQLNDRLHDVDHDVSRAVSASRADAVVLGARGVGGVERLRLGSVAEGMLAESPASVPIVR